MLTRKRSVFALSVAAVLAVPGSLALMQPAQAAHFGYNNLSSIQKRLVSGALSTTHPPSAVEASIIARDPPAVDFSSA